MELLHFQIMPKDDEILHHLQRQDCRWTVVRLKDGSKLRIYNITWGYDLGDDYAHIFTNISPEQEDADIDLFYTHEIVEIRDEETDRTIFSA